MSHKPAGEPGDPPSTDDQQGPPSEVPHSDFAATAPDSALDLGPDVWAESTDGHCSEHAALFAASQPAPLNVV